MKRCERDPIWGRGECDPGPPKGNSSRAIMANPWILGVPKHGGAQMFFCWSFLRFCCVTGAGHGGIASMLGENIVLDKALAASLCFVGHIYIWAQFRVNILELV